MYVRCLKMRILRILRGEFCDENVKFMAAMGRPDIRHPFGCNSVALHSDMMVLFGFSYTPMGGEYVAAPWQP